MADISKCDDNLCPVKDRCYRWTAKANPHWQSYIRTQHKGKHGCDYYWENDKRKYKNNE